MNPNAFLLVAQAAAQGSGPQPNPLLQFVPLIFIFVIFYFLLIRPQQKQRKEHQQLVSTIKTGDRVVLASGIHGVISNVKDSTILVRVADNVKIEFDRSSVTSVERDADSSPTT